MLIQGFREAVRASRAVKCKLDILLGEQAVQSLPMWSNLTSPAFHIICFLSVKYGLDAMWGILSAETTGALAKHVLHAGSMCRVELHS